MAFLNGIPVSLERVGAVTEPSGVPPLEFLRRNLV